MNVEDLIRAVVGGVPQPAEQLRAFANGVADGAISTETARAGSKPFTSTA